MAASSYRFLPWVRRGLAERIADADSGGALHARATVEVGVTVAPLPAARYALSVHGPGDVLGIDPRIILRTDPRAAASDVEPNYFAQVEFDPPDFPWLFTPARAGADNRLRPWLVLIVVDLARVDAPRSEGGQPLPVLHIAREVTALELPSLDESWAWAHAQALVPTGNVDLAAALTDQPALNVSRLVAPRRLESNRQYAACLVPAFDAGVVRGLGGTPDASQPLTPAWTLPTTGDIDLPVYFHWRFTTGVAGDFESLARRLQPIQAADTLGTQPMYIGAAGPELPSLASDDPRAILLMDGALRAPQRGSAGLDDVAGEVRQALEQALDANAAQAGGTPGVSSTGVLGAPVYGAWHARQHTVPADVPTWLRELNLDPRARAAAGLGAEIERRYQDTFMQWSWEQVGRILEANRLLSRTRLSLEALARVHARHFVTQPVDRLLQLTAPLHARTPSGAATLHGTVATSSLPDAFADPALRRLTSSQRPVLRAALRRMPALSGATASTPGSGANRPPRVRLVERLGQGQLDVDPARFVPHGLGAVDDLDRIVIPASGNAAVDLSPIGLPVSVPASVLRTLRSDAAAATSTPKLMARADLHTAGVLGSAHLERVQALLDSSPSPWLGVSDTLSDVIAKASVTVNATALLLTLPDAAQPTRLPSVDALDIDSHGQVLVRAQGDQAPSIVATLDTTSAPASRATIGRTLAALPANTLLRDGATIRASSTAPVRAAPVTRGAVIAPTTPSDTLHPSAPLAPVRPLPTIPSVPVRPIDTLPPVRPTPTTPTVPTVPVTPSDTVTPTEPPVDPLPNPPGSITLPAVLRDSATITRLQDALLEVAPAGTLGTTPVQPVLVPFALATAATTVLARTQPRTWVPKRLDSVLLADGSRVLDTPPDTLVVTPSTDRVLAYPELDVPVYEYLAQLDQQRFLPGVGSIPPDSIMLLETNPRFTEALLLGLNTEMNRELLFRGFPTDQRGTPFRHFWAWSDGGADIAPIHRFAPTQALGANSRGGRGGQIALVLRGRLLHRYPNTSIYAWRSRAGALIEPPAVGDIKAPVFAGTLGDDIAFAGFDLTDSDLTTGDGWFFVLAQQPTEPRFGFDESAAVGADGSSWSDATWRDTATDPGNWLRIATNPLAGQRRGAARFVDDAGHLAAITLQKPVRVAVHAKSLFTRDDGGSGNG